MQQKIEVNTSWMFPNTPCWVQVSTEDSDVYPELFARAIVVKVDEQKVTVAFEKEEGLQTEWQAALIYQINEYDEKGFSDMVAMEQLNEAEILNNLRIRYVKDRIFTYIGPTLMVMNPYKSIDNQLGPNILKVYQDQAKSVGVPFNLRESQPHTYAIAANAFYCLFANGKNQAIVISGESGAGKTENAKIAMKFLTSLSELTSGAKVADNTPRIEDKIMACNPILEAFGNAKTVRNDNSSRFGKYVRIIVNQSSRKIKGAAINNYLLEKSRVVGPGPQERNYHIFYHILKGADQSMREQLHLIDESKGTPYTAQDFTFLTMGECIEVPTVNDQKLYDEMMESFANINFSKDELMTTMSIIVSVLFLGNINFDTSTLTDKDPLSIQKSDQLLFQKVAKLLQMEENQLLKTLTIKTREVGKQLIESPLNEADAISNKNALASNIYDRLFSWVVKRLNQTIIPQETLNPDSIRKSIAAIKRMSMMGQILSIGLLDIFGFENFKHNSFEQFCINYTNEKLQQLYISYVFKSEELEFIAEGLKDSLTKLSYSDNSAVIELMDKTSVGIFDLIDEATQLGSGTDEQLYQKIIKGKHSNLIVPKMAKDKFSIVHTAKNVEYNIQGFRNKNKSEISLDLVKGIMGSKNQTLHQIFLVLCGKEVDKKEEEIEKMKKPSKTEKFLGAKFRQQMKLLMEELSTSDCHFIRCLKPNEQKIKEKVVCSYTLLQIKYLGVLESIKVRKDGYPFRKDYKGFYQQYYELSAKYKDTNVWKQKGDLKQISKEIFEELLPNLPPDTVLCGTSKFFAKDFVSRQLDLLMENWFKKQTFSSQKITRLFQVNMVRKMYKKNLVKLVQAVNKFKVIQAVYKGKKQRQKYLNKKKSIQNLRQNQNKQVTKLRFKFWENRVRQIVKIEKQTQSLNLLFTIVSQAKLRGAIQKYSRIAYKIKMIQQLVKNYLKLNMVQKKKYITRYKSQVIVKIAQIEEAKRQAEEARRIQEALRVEAERKELERKELERQEFERKELERQEFERMETERKENERKEEERKEAERKENDRKEKERMEAEKQEAEKIELLRKQAQIETERLETERILKAKQEADMIEADRQEQERMDALRQEEERKEKERREAEIARLEMLKKEADQKEKERQESERKEFERQQLERSDTERLEFERQFREQEQLEAEKRENEQKELEKQALIQEQNRIEEEVKLVQLLEEQSQNERQKLEKQKAEALLLEQQQEEAMKTKQISQPQPDFTKQVQNSIVVEETYEPSPTNEVIAQDIQWNLQSNQNQRHKQDVFEEEKTYNKDPNEFDINFEVQQERGRTTSVAFDIVKNISTEESEMNPFIVSQDIFSAKYPESTDLNESKDQTETFEGLDRGFVKTVNQTGFLDTCDGSLRKVKGIFSDMDIEKVITFTKEPISKFSLTQIDEQYLGQIIQCWNLIYLNQTRIAALLTPGQVQRNIDQLMNIINGKEVIIDEVYIQLLKQIRQCEDVQLQVYYGQVVLSLASVYPPSRLWYFPILNYLYIASRQFDGLQIPQMNIQHKLEVKIQTKETSNILRMAFFRLIKTFTSPNRRRYTPNLVEIGLTLQFKQIPVAINIYMFNTTYVTIEPHFSVLQFKQSLCQKLKIKHLSNKLGISLVRSETQENLINENELIIDVVRGIEIRCAQIQKDKLKTSLPYLSLKISQFFAFEQSDFNSINVYINHFVQEYLKGNFQLNRKQVISLSALKVVVDYGNIFYNNGRAPPIYIQFQSIKNMFPLIRIENMIGFKRSLTSILSWLTYLKIKPKLLFWKNQENKYQFKFFNKFKPLFLTWQYHCKRQIGKGFYETSLLALKPFSLVICDQYKIIHRYQLLQIITFNQFQQYIQILTDDGSTYIFQMQDKSDAKGLSNIYQAYMDKAMAWEKSI